MFTKVTLCECERERFTNKSQSENCFNNFESCIRL